MRLRGDVPLPARKSRDLPVRSLLFSANRRAAARKAGGRICAARRDGKPGMICRIVPGGDCQKTGKASDFGGKESVKGNRQGSLSRSIKPFSKLFQSLENVSLSKNEGTAFETEKQGSSRGQGPPRIGSASVRKSRFQAFSGIVFCRMAKYALASLSKKSPSGTFLTS